MGANASAINTATVANNTSVNSQSACAAAETVNITNGPVTIINSKCKSLDINSITSGVQSNCTFNTQVAATAKATADQVANAKADSGLPVAADFVSSSSANIVNLQNNIEMSLNATCGAQQNETITNGPIVLNGDYIDGPCTINNTSNSVNLMCAFNMHASTNEAGSTQQSSTAIAENTDLSFLLIIAAVALVGLIVLLGGGRLIWRLVTAPLRSAAHLIEESRKKTLKTEVELTKAPNAAATRNLGPVKGATRLGPPATGATRPAPPTPLGVRTVGTGV